MIQYQNYHRHSWYTNTKISDSTVSPEQYAKRAVELGGAILSSMEHGYQGNYYETVKIAKKYGLKPVIGSECYWVKDRTLPDKTNCHIYIGAKNENGRLALNDMLSEANISGFYFQPRIDIGQILALPKNDVIVTSACIAGWKYEDAESIMVDFAKHFGKNFFLEVQYHNTESQITLNRKIIEIHNREKIPLIMGCDSHYIYEKQSTDRDDFLVSKGLHYEDEDGWFLDYPSGDDAYSRFANQCVLNHQQIMDAIDNTGVFLDVEEYNTDIFQDNIKMVSLFPDKDQEFKNKEYERLIWAGWDAYKKEVPEERHELYRSEIQAEIDAVEECGMSDYFIVNHSIIKKGKENGGWLTKSGRGSAVSFITNKLLGFTEVDRIAAKIKMYPERFLSATRILQSHTLPDIDFNIAPVEPFAVAQKEVLGDDHAYPMISYGTMKTSAAWKLYAKAQGIPFDISNGVSEDLKRYESALKHADEDEKDDIKVEKYISKEYLKIFEDSKTYLGLISSWSIAPCSYLLYMGSIRKEIGLIRIKDHLCCLMDGHWAEECHFLKNDLLKVSVVEAIYKMFHKIGIEPPSVNELLAMTPPDDPAWSVYDRGCCLSINQVEKEGTASRVSKYKPKNISELAAFVAAIRPGSASIYKQFESREPFSYGVKAFDDLLQTEEMPNSFILYQEQEMNVLSFAGISRTETYTAIKNIAKKRAEKVLAYKEVFMSGFTKAIQAEGKTEEESKELTDKLWTLIEDSASYSFNASHSYCVALDSLYGAWMKAHHPLQFYETCIEIQEAKGDKDKINALKAEAEDYFGIKFAPLRFGQDNRTLHADEANNQFINMISSIKGYSAKVGNVLYEAGKNDFDSFSSLLRWLDKHEIKEAKYKPLIQIDYFSRFGNQKELLEIARIWEFFKQGTCKSVKKSLVANPDLYEIISKHTTSTKKDGSEAMSFTFATQDDVFACIRECEKHIMSLRLKDVDMRVRVQNSIDILGYVDVVTGKEEDRRRLIVTDIIPLKDKVKGTIWSYRIGTKSLGSGKAARLSIKADIFDRYPINAGDIIYAHDLWKNNAGYWYLQRYEKE